MAVKITHEELQIVSLSLTHVPWSSHKEVQAPKVTEYLGSTRKLIKVRVYLWSKIGLVSFTQEAELLNIFIPVYYVKPSGSQYENLHQNQSC